MSEETEQKSQSSQVDNELKLYSLLVDQILRYQTIIWQIPTALVVANFLAIDKLANQRWEMAALAAFNMALIFVFWRMIVSQRKIIEATKNAESVLLAKFKNFLPKFKPHHVVAPYVFAAVLFTLEIGLCVRVWDLFIEQPKQATVEPCVKHSHHKNHHRCTDQDSCAIHDTD
jgi:hypothetical protein